MFSRFLEKNQTNNQHQRLSTSLNIVIILVIILEWFMNPLSSKWGHGGCGCDVCA